MLCVVFTIVSCLQWCCIYSCVVFTVLSCFKLCGVYSVTVVLYLQLCRVYSCVALTYLSKQTMSCTLPSGTGNSGNFLPNLLPERMTVTVSWVRHAWTQDRDPLTCHAHTLTPAHHSKAAVMAATFNHELDATDWQAPLWSATTFPLVWAEKPLPVLP